MALVRTLLLSFPYPDSSLAMKHFFVFFLFFANQCTDLYDHGWRILPSSIKAQVSVNVHFIFVLVLFFLIVRYMRRDGFYVVTKPLVIERRFV